MFGHHGDREYRAAQRPTFTPRSRIRPHPQTRRPYSHPHTHPTRTPPARGQMCQQIRRPQHAADRYTDADRICSPPPTHRMRLHNFLVTVVVAGSDGRRWYLCATRALRSKNRTTQRKGPHQTRVQMKVHEDPGDQSVEPHSGATLPQLRMRFDEGPAIIRRGRSAGS